MEPSHGMITVAPPLAYAWGEETPSLSSPASVAKTGGGGSALKRSESGETVGASADGPVLAKSVPPYPAWSSNPISRSWPRKCIRWPYCCIPAFSMAGEATTAAGTITPRVPTFTHQPILIILFTCRRVVS